MSDKRKRTGPSSSAAERPGQVGSRGGQSQVRSAPRSLQNLAPQPSRPLQPSEPATAPPISLSNLQLPASASSRPTLSQNPETPLHQPSGSRSGKVAIPRIPRDVESEAAKVDKQRVMHACEPCRQRKTKCSGERPICQHCQDYAIACVYADAKRDRVKKELDTLRKRLADYERLLRSVSSQLDEAGKIAIHKTLSKVSMDDHEHLQHVDSFKSATNSMGSRREASGDGEPNYDSGGESDVSGDAGSTGSLDRAMEDVNLNADTRATGYMGKNSEVVWVQRLRALAESESNASSAWPGESGYGPSDEHQMSGSGVSESHQRAVRKGEAGGGGSRQTGNVSISDSGYHLDDKAITISEKVDPYALPVRQVADQYIACYFKTVHPSFPIVFRPTFLKDYKAYMDGEDNRRPVDKGRKWLAIMNLILALGAKHALLSASQPQDGPLDDMRLFTRARMLSMNNDAIIDHPDLEQIQCTALMTIYLITIGQINRAWNLCGLAIRFALTLGLNLRTTVRTISGIEKEHRVRLWWSIYGLERHLGIMTGRPSSISDGDCTIALPIPIDEEDLTDEIYDKYTIEERQADLSSSSRTSAGRRRSQSGTGEEASDDTPVNRENLAVLSEDKLWNTFRLQGQPNAATYFVNFTQMSMLTHQIITSLYRAETRNRSWAGIQRGIHSLEEKLHRWKFMLPQDFDFESNSAGDRDEMFTKYRTNLAFFFYSSKILLYRPCLCRTERKMPKESRRSADFNRESAEKCMAAATNIIRLLSDVPDPAELYQLSLWWIVLHYIMQATIVLLLELAFHAEHVPAKAAAMVQDSTKAVSWLKSMSYGDLSASRAYEICNQMLQIVAPRVGRGDEVSGSMARIDAMPSPHKSASDSLAQLSSEQGSGQNDMFQQAPHPQVPYARQWSPVQQDLFSAPSPDSGSYQPMDMDAYDPDQFLEQFPDMSYYGPPPPAHLNQSTRSPRPSIPPTTSTSRSRACSCRIRTRSMWRPWTRRLARRLMVSRRMRP